MEMTAVISPLMLMSHDYKLLSVQIGSIRPLQSGHKKIMSAIRKVPVQGNIIVGSLGLQGDEQADLSVHGGLSKAVYAYPSEHYPFWQEQKAILGLPPVLPFGSLGENLTLSGLLEQDVFVGDKLHFPDCVLRVTGLRKPCFKFNAIMGDKQAAKKMIKTGFYGFYLAVDKTGSIASGQAFELRAGPRQVAICSLFESDSKV